MEVGNGASKAETERFYRALCSPTHHLVYGGILPEFFMFNNPESACRTCGGTMEIGNLPVFICSKCQGVDVEVIAGEEFLITSRDLAEA